LALWARDGFKLSQFRLRWIGGSYDPHAQRRSACVAVNWSSPPESEIGDPEAGSSRAPRGCRANGSGELLGDLRECAAGNSSPYGIVLVGTAGVGGTLEVGQRFNAVTRGQPLESHTVDKPLDVTTLHSY